MEPKFVGRAAEAQILASALGQAEAGKGSLVLLAGEPGIGKSRLLDEAARRAAESGACVTWGRSWEAGGAPAYWVWTEALGALVADLDAEWSEHPDEWVHELRDILPEVDTHRERRRIARDLDDARFRLFAAVGRLLDAASVDRPVVVLLDDLHAADTASLLLLRFLARHANSRRLLIVGAYRDAELTASHPFTATLEHLLRESAVTRLRLRPLDVEAVARIVEAATGSPAPSDLVQRVWFHSDGNPLYVREVVELVIAEGQLLVSADRLVIPRDLRATILRRLAGLPERCTELLGAASVIGRDVPVDVLAEVTGVGDPLAALADAVVMNVIAESPDTAGQLRFSHVVVRDALYYDLPPARRAVLHLRAGEALEGRRPADPDAHVTELALHFSAAASVGGRDHAVDYSRLAGGQAMRLLAFEEAARWYSLALAAVDNAAAGAGETRLPLLLALGEAKARAGETAHSKEHFLAAASLARELDRPQEFGLAAIGYGGRFPWLRAGNDRIVIPLLREAVATVTDDNTLRSQLLARLATALRDEADRTERTALSAEAVDLADRSGDPATQAYARIARVAAIWSPENHEDLVEIASEAADLARRSGDGERISDVGWLQFETFLEAGDARSARAIAARYDRMAVELRQPAQRWYAGVMRYVLQLMDGPLDSVEALIDETAEAGRLVQGWDAEVSYRLAIAVLRWEQGRLPEVEGVLAGSVAEYPGYRLFRCLLALAYAEAGRAASAASLAREVLDGDEEGLPVDNGWLFGMTVLAQVAAHLEDIDLAGRLYPNLTPFAHLVAAAAGEVIGGSTSRSLGQLATLLERYEDAEQHFADAMAVHAEMGSTVWTAHTCYDEAVMRTRRGTPADLDRASHLLATALAACDRAGMVALAARIAGLGTSATPAGPEVRLGDLTNREMEVASLVAQGMSNRNIAEKLFVSERTVETHVQNILRKLDCRSRTQVAARMLGPGAKQVT